MPTPYPAPHQKNLMDAVPDPPSIRSACAHDLDAVVILQGHSQYGWGQVTYAPEGTLRVDVGNKHLDRTTVARYLDSTTNSARNKDVIKSTIMCSLYPYQCNVIYR
ncbi:MAG: hypothetical protein H7240_01910 [Glaciimonas sp.]|nr:hypothetical protein [Glaciimonas sp.]